MNSVHILHIFYHKMGNYIAGNGKWRHSFEVSANHFEALRYTGNHIATKVYQRSQEQLVIDLRIETETVEDEPVLEQKKSKLCSAEDFLKARNINKNKSIEKKGLVVNISFLLYFHVICCCLQKHRLACLSLSYLRFKLLQHQVRSQSSLRLSPCNLHSSLL